MKVCPACGQEMYFLKTINDKSIPVNAETVSALDRVAIEALLKEIDTEW
jgi:hypothetical protein